MMRRLGDDLRAVAVPFVVVRILVGLGYVLARGVHERWYAVPPQAFTEGLVAWDGTFYRDIGTVGYEHLPLEALRFFPLFPLIGRAVSLLFDGNQGFALIVVANVSALALAVVVRRLTFDLVAHPEGHEPGAGLLVEQAPPDAVVAEEEVPESLRAEATRVSDRAVMAVLLFPGAFVLVWAYSEALFLALGAGALLLARKQRWLLAAGCAAAAALTRPLGLLLVVPLALEAYRTFRRPTAEWPDKVAAVLGAAAPVVGTGAYVLWVERAWGQFGLPFTVQSDFRGESMDPASRLLRGVFDLAGAERFGDGLHLPFAVLLVWLLVVAWRRLPRPLVLYAGLVVLVALGSANLNSLERYGLNAFPLAIALAMWASTRRREWWILAIGGNGIVALSALAWLGLYVP